MWVADKIDLHWISAEREVDSLQWGDILSSNELFEQFATELRTYAFIFTMDFDQAEDCVSHIYTKLYEKWRHDLPEHIMIIPYAKRAIRNHHIDRKRLESTQNREYFVEAFDELSPERISEQREKFANLMRMINNMPLNDRELLTLLMQGHNYREISTIMDIPIGTVSSRMARARNKLYRELTLEDCTNGG
jgi:RNA polymerase sigma-70 factor (ECF subfamily)